MLPSSQPGGWNQLDPNTTYQHWDVFTVPVGPSNSPDVALFNPNGSPTLANSTADAILLGGNIYSPGGPENVTINVPNYGLGAPWTTAVFLQTHTRGTEIDPATVLLDGLAPSGSLELSRTSLGGQGFAVETLWRWDSVPGNAATNSIGFLALGPHLSLAAVAVDTLTVPEPSGFVLAAVAGLGIFGLRLARKRGAKGLPRFGASVVVAMFLSIAIGCASTASAAFVLPTRWAREDARSTYQEWDVFTDADGDPANAPDVGLFNPNAPANGTPNVYDTSGTSFLTGGGNIYSFSAPTDIDVVIPNDGLGGDFHTTAILQIRTGGSEADYGAVHIGGASPVFGVELLREPSGSTFGGDNVEYLLRWELDGNVASYLIEFPASASSMSLDRVAVDTFVVLAGDANADDAVNIFDVGEISDHWQSAGPAGDVNFDGSVDIFDVGVVSDHWLNSAGAAAVAAPEPASISLVVAGSAMLAVICRRRK